MVVHLTALAGAEVAFVDREISTLPPRATATKTLFVPVAELK